MLLKRKVSKKQKTSAFFAIMIRKKHLKGIYHDFNYRCKWATWNGASPFVR